MRESISNSKYKTTFLLQPVEKVEKDMLDVLECIFWRKPELSSPALKFLNEIKRRKGIEDSHWEEFCKNQKITRGQYDSIIKKLRGSGLIYKRDGVWKLCDDFEGFLGTILEITNRWKAKEGK